MPKEAAVPGCGQCFTEVGLLGRTFGQTLRCDRRGQLTTWISEALIVNCMTAFCWTARAHGSRRSAGGPNEAKIRAGQSKSTPMHSLLWHLQAYAWSLVFESRFGQRFPSLGRTVGVPFSRAAHNNDAQATERGASCGAGGASVRAGGARGVSVHIAGRLGGGSSWRELK